MRFSLAISANDWKTTGVLLGPELLAVRLVPIKVHDVLLLNVCLQEVEAVHFIVCMAGLVVYLHPLHVGILWGQVLIKRPVSIALYHVGVSFLTTPVSNPEEVVPSVLRYRVTARDQVVVADAVTDHRLRVVGTSCEDSGEEGESASDLHSSFLG